MISSQPLRPQVDHPFPPHEDGPAGQTVEVKGVERLAVLEEDIIGDVDEIVDRAGPTSREPALHPLRRGPDPHAFDQPSDVARTPLRLFNPNG